MSLFFTKQAVEQRQLSVPWSHGDAAPLMSSLDAQLSVIPAYAAIRLISDAISSLPLQAYRKVGTGREQIPTPAMFTGAGVETGVNWLGRAAVSWLARGNAVGLKSGFDNETDLAKQITWLHPDHVYVDGTVAMPNWRYKGRPLDRSMVVHIPAVVVPEQILGMSPLTACRTALETGGATQTFTRDWFRGKAIPGLTLKNTAKTLNPTDAAAVKDRMKATMRAGEPFVTGSDWDLDVISLPAEDAGFIVASRLTATQIATIYGVPPELIGGETGASMTYTTTEQQQIQLSTTAVRPALVRFEAAFNALLPKPQYVKFNADASIRVNLAGRYEAHRISREIGLNNIDELRALEDQQPLPDGKGQDYTPLGKGGPPPKETR